MKKTNEMKLIRVTIIPKTKEKKRLIRVVSQLSYLTKL